MRLLQSDSRGNLSLTTDLIDDFPRYAILSHTWGADGDEVTFDDLQNGAGRDKTGYAKLQFCREQAIRDELDYFWVDTCCIDKRNSTELSEAIASMFQWYHKAVKCYVYLSDISVNILDSDGIQHPGEPDISKSRWFTRGWTLQELLAPAVVNFYSQEGQFLGNKNTLEEIIHKITRIPATALSGASLSDFSVAERLQWASGRTTKRTEDKAYCLQGIFGVFLPLIYGEGENAFNRLREAIAEASRTTEYDIRSRQKLLDTLPSLDFDIKHEKTYHECLAGTGRWFLSSKVFQTWLVAQGGLLWCPGIPGAGKTVMASIVVEKLRQICTEDKESITVFIYFDYALQKQQNMTALFGDLLAQVLRKCSTVPSEINEEFALLQRSRAFTKRDYLSLLRIALNPFSRVFVVVDALDECVEWEQRGFMSDLQSVGTHTNILVTSRHSNSFTKIFEDGDRIDITAATIDMEAYIHKSLQGHYELSDMIQEDPEFEGKIIAIILESAQNMFLLLKLHIQSLVCMISKNEILQALKTLPKGLDDTYDRALERIHEQSEWMKGPAIKALTWLSLSFRPLSLTEMQHALSVKPSHLRFDKDNLMPLVHKLASACAGLVMIDKPGNNVILTHYTTREYLVNHLDKLLPTPHLQMAKVCLTYLSFKDFEQIKDRNEILQDQPFAAYASRYWGFHAHEAGQLDSDGQYLTLKLLQREFRTNDTFTLEPTDRDSSNTDPHRSYISRDRPNGVHLAAHFGLQAEVQKLLERGTDINSRDANGNTALHYAAWQGQNTIIRILIESGADPSPKNYKQAAPLQCAAVSGRNETVRLLLAHGADVNYNPSGSQATLPALHEAIRYDQSDMIDELLRLGADKELLSAETKISPLSLACSWRRARSLSELLKHRPSVQGDEGRQALSQVMSHYYFDESAQYSDTIGVLTASDIDLNQSLDGGYSALDLALQFSQGAVIEILLQANARTRLDWYCDQPAIQKWMDRGWFPKLIYHCLNAPASVDRPADLQPTSFTRTRDTSGVFSWTETWQHTVGLYAHWPRPLFYVDIDYLVNDPLWMKFLPYIKTTIPENFVRVEQIVITTESHDQGYSDHYSHDAGTYRSSFTWFDIAFVYHRHPGHTMWVDLIQYNVQSKWDWTTHTNILSTADPKTDRDWARADAVWNLRPGDTVMLYPKAMYQGWQNHLRHAEIKILGMEKKPEHEARSTD